MPFDDGFYRQVEARMMMFSCADRSVATAFFFHEFVPCMNRDGDPARPLPPVGPATRPSSTAVEGVLGVILLL